MQRFDPDFGSMRTVWRKRRLVSVLLLGFGTILFGLRGLSFVERDDFEKKRAAPDQIEGILKLIRRRVPKNDIDLIRIEVLESEEEGFEIEKIGDVVVLRGSSVSALAYGLNMFYRKICQSNLISWASNQRPSKSCIAKLEERKFLELTKARVSVRYYLNQVTWSYSMSTWNFERWSQELDWMALRGINLALAPVGAQSIWQRIWNDLLDGDFAPEDFFTGAAYLSWHWMGNLQKLGHPVSQRWLDDQLRLQHKILQRMWELGIQPILPAFNLHVPEKIVDKFGITTFQRSSEWSGFYRPYSGLIRLRPGDPLAKRISSLVIKEQLREYGSKFMGFYSIDLYNEMDPGESDVAEDLKAVFESVSAVDQDAVLVMQMWCFAHARMVWTKQLVENLLQGAPKDRVLLLDLHGEKRPQWKRLRSVLSSRRVIWNYLHNFGGSNGMAGEMNHVTRAIDEAIEIGHVEGIGLAMEGIEQNEIVYDHALDHAWSCVERDRDTWIREWASARNQGRKKWNEAWICAGETAYDRKWNDIGWGVTKSLFESNGESFLFQPTVIPYESFFPCANEFVSQFVGEDDFDEVSLYDAIAFVKQVGADENDEEILEGILKLHPKWKWTCPGCDMVEEGHRKDLEMLFTTWSDNNHQVLHKYASRLSWDMFVASDEREKHKVDERNWKEQGKALLNAWHTWTNEEKKKL